MNFFFNSNYPSLPAVIKSSCSSLKENNDGLTLNKMKQSIPNENPVIKFKSTFVPAQRAETKDPSESEGNQKSSSISKTLNYDQVLKIKKMNRRKLKLLGRKKELKELKSQKKSLAAESEARKKLKKRVKRLKKLIKKEKAKIRKLKKYESCSSGESSGEESDRIEITSLDCDEKRKLSACEDFDQLSCSKKQKTNSLSLLKQYSSSSSSDESESSSRSSRSSSRSSTASADSKQPKSPVEGKLEENRLLEDNTFNKLVSNGDNINRSVSSSHNSSDTTLSNQSILKGCVSEQPPETTEYKSEKNLAAQLPASYVSSK